MDEQLRTRYIYENHALDNIITMIIRIYLLPVN